MKALAACGSPCASQPASHYFLLLRLFLVRYLPIHMQVVVHDRNNGVRWLFVVK